MTKNLTLAGVVGTLGLSVAAQGAIISNVYNFPNVLLSSNPTLSVTPFDPSLGTLTKVEVVSSGNAKAVVTVINFSGVAQSFTNGHTSGPASLSGPSVSLTETVSVSGLADPVTSATSEQLFPDAGAGTSMADDFVLTTPTELAQYTSPSVIQFSLGDGIFSSGASFTPGGFVFAGGDAQSAGIGLQVTYTYTPVPEPASLALLGLGALGLIKRRRHAA